MNVLIHDNETTIHSKGNPFDVRNKFVLGGIKRLYDVAVTTNSYRLMQTAFDWADLIVGFNLKFDLHWDKNIGLNFEGKRVWDCQLAEFILNHQRTPYPSLNDTCEKYALPLKLDIVKTEYWEKGIDTDQIPTKILQEYLEGDLNITEQVYLKQLEQFKQNPKLFQLFKLQCWDLLVLQEMEYNGIFFNVEKANKKADELLCESSEIYATLSGYFGGAPINLSSNDHKSCLLYGGTISVDDRIPVGVFKTGKKIGEPRYKVVTREFVLPRLVEPLEKSELQKEGYWSTDDKTLRALKGNKEVKNIIKLLQRYAELEKLRNTYMIGFPKLIESMHWKPNTIHGTFNQCQAITGRLSSSKPNLQNADGETKKLMESRYG